MVWFYHDMQLFTSLGTAVFQSHYGLILSPPFFLTIYAILGAFNPTMVWFYLTDAGVPASVAAAFQSHYGLILSK